MRTTIKMMAVVIAVLLLAAAASADVTMIAMKPTAHGEYIIWTSTTTVGRYAVVNDKLTCLEELSIEDYPYSTPINPREDLSND